MSLPFGASESIGTTKTTVSPGLASPSKRLLSSSSLLILSAINLDSISFKAWLSCPIDVNRQSDACPIDLL